MKVLKEWFVEAPWGDIALISWGNPAGEPVLLVHGRLDSAATFIPLLEHLPDTYYYVGVDLPGHGKSTPFPQGVTLMRFHFVAAIAVVIKHLEWTEFSYIAHSMGCEQGLFFNAVQPGRIKKMVLLDPGPSLQRLQMRDLVDYYNTFYYGYYSNYGKYNGETKLYSRRKALDSVKKARGFTDSQAEVILSRNLIQVGDDLFRLSWDYRLKHLAPQNYPVDYYYQLFSKNSPPTLLCAATVNNARPYAEGKKAAKEIIDRLERNLNNFKVIVVEGGHDVHFTNPERMGREINEFLQKDFGKLPKPEKYCDDMTKDLEAFAKSKL